MQVGVQVNGRAFSLRRHSRHYDVKTPKVLGPPLAPRWTVDRIPADPGSVINVPSVFPGRYAVICFGEIPYYGLSVITTLFDKDLAAIAVDVAFEQRMLRRLRLRFRRR